MIIDSVDLYMIMIIVSSHCFFMRGIFGMYIDIAASLCNKVIKCIDMSCMIVYNYTRCFVDYILL